MGGVGAPVVAAGVQVPVHVSAVGVGGGADVGDEASGVDERVVVLA